MENSPQTRPAVRRLTEFYLCISIGGVLGGLFNALLAPLIFRTVFELPLALILAALLRPTVESKVLTASAAVWAEAQRLVASNRAWPVYGRRHRGA